MEKEIKMKENVKIVNIMHNIILNAIRITI